VTVLPNGATAQKLTLSKVNYGTRNNLVALKVQNGNVETFYTVEYRPRSQWDAGLDAGLRGEFVIHRIRDVGNVGQNAPGRNDWPKPNAVTLVGSLPQCGNLDFSANGVGIRVVDRNEFRATVSVGASLPAGAGVIIKASESSSLLSTTSSNQTAVVNDVGPRCQSANYTVLIDRYQSTVIIAAECHGIIDPRFRFLFNGNPVLAGAWSGPGTSLMGFENWKLSIYQPTSLTNGVDASGSFSVNVSIFENQLSVNLPVGLGDISMSLGVEVSSGSAGLVVGTATTQVVAKTLIYRLPDEAYLDQGACLLSQVIRVQRSWPPSDNEHPDWEQRLKEVVNQATYPIDINQGLIAKFAADFGVTPQTLKPALDTIALRTR
jgi:hypothetical protein